METLSFRGYQVARESEERYKYFVKEDFKGASILDLGCNEGLMLDKAKEWGAEMAIGFEKDLVNKHENIVVCDLNSIDHIIPFDVVLVLSVIRFIKNKRKFMQMVAGCAKKVIYFEGHQQEFIKDNFNLIKPDVFEWTKLGETPVGRPFYRGVRKLQ